MTTKQAKLSKEDLQKVAHIEVSIQHWQGEHTNLHLKARKVLDNIDSLYQARAQILNAAYKEAGIDSQLVEHTNIDHEGNITVHCADPAPVTTSDLPSSGCGCPDDQVQSSS